MTKVQLHTGPGVIEVLVNVCRNPQEALKQFVENAADAIEQAASQDGRISIELRYRQYRMDGTGRADGALHTITVSDNGIGLTPEKMEHVLQRIGDSEKLSLVLRGEQGIGLLAFAQIAEEVHLASSAEEGRPSSCLVIKRAWLRRGRAEIVEHCPEHEHNHRGTVVHLENVLTEVSSALARDRIKEYLGQQFANDLRAGLYTMSLSDGGGFEEIHSHRFHGVKVMSASLPMNGAGAAFAELYVLPWELPDATISLYGRGGTRICSLTDIADLKRLPWLDHRLEGYIRCDRLKRTADKTAVVQDKVFGVFVAALADIEPQVQQLIENISAESQERRFNIIIGKAGKLIDKFLRYRDRGLLSDLPVLTAAGLDRGTGVPPTQRYLPLPGTPGNGNGKGNGNGHSTAVRRASRAPSIALRSLPREKEYYRSWYDGDSGVIVINREHSEFLLAQREDRRCLRYLFSIWVKESLLQEHGGDAERVADEMVGVLAEAEPLLW